MNEIEELLRRDREAGTPEPPDVRYTVAAIQRRMGQAPAPAEAKRAPAADLPLLAASFGLVMAIAILTLNRGLSPWWLLLIPAGAIPLWPILTRKGAWR